MKKGKKVLSLLIVLIILIGIFAVPVSADVGDHSYRENESNDYTYYADVIYDDYTITASVSRYDMDYFVFNLKEKSTVTVVCVADYNVLMMGLYDSSEDILKAYKTSYSNGSYSLSMKYTLSAGKYYLLFLNDDYYSSSNGYMFYFTYTPVAHTHSYTSSVTKPTCQTQGYTTYTCSCGYSYIGNYTSKSDHEMGIWVNTEDATCGTAGKKVRYCSTLNCDYSETQTIPATGDHEMGEWHTIPATCYEAGEKYRYCSKCEYMENVILPSSHDFEEVTLPATCGVDGKITKTCQDCDYTEDVIIPATGDHALSEWRIIEPTCTKDGERSRTCENCDFTETEVLKGEHNFNKNTKLSATITKDGYILEECSVCGEEYNKTIIYHPETFKLSTTQYTYNGKAKTPSVKVYDTKGKIISSKNYTVSYAKGRKNVGKYKVTISFKGDYSGTKSLYFTIKPGKTSVNKLTAYKKSMKVTVNKKTSQVSGYQVQYSTSKKFTSAKTKNISGYKTTSVTLKGLSRNKTYYVRVRTYKTVDGKRYYSDWSSYKYTKTK